MSPHTAHHDAGTTPRGRAAAIRLPLTAPLPAGGPTGREPVGDAFEGTTRGLSRAMAL